MVAHHQQLDLTLYPPGGEPRPRPLIRWTCTCHSDRRLTFGGLAETTNHVRAAKEALPELLRLIRLGAPRGIWEVELRDATGARRIGERYIRAIWTSVLGLRAFLL